MCTASLGSDRVYVEHSHGASACRLVRAALLAARFVISDLTHDSFGAYWEAGFGEGCGIPVIYMCEKGKWEDSKTHFDTNHMGTIIWEAGDLKKGQETLVAMIRATLRAEAKQIDE
jgi:hypothetical protein